MTRAIRKCQEGATMIEVLHQDYITNARALGFPAYRVILQDGLQNSLVSILTVSGLSFLGVGAQPPTPEWGLMLSEAQRFVLNAPHMGIFPGVGIMAAVLSFNLIGDALRDRLDPLVAQTVRR